MSQSVSQSDLQVHLCSFKVRQSRQCREEETKEWEEGDWVRVRLFAAMMSAAAFAVVVVFSSLLSSSPPFPSIPFPSSLPFSNPLPKPVVFQLFSQNQSNGTSCSTDPGMSPPGRRHGRPVFPSNGWPVLSPVVIFTRWMAGFFHRSYFSPSGWPVLSPVMSLTWWVAGFVTGDRR